MTTSVKNKGLYLYCIRAGGFPSIKIEKSIDGKSESFSIFHNDLELIVSEVDLDEFGSEDIQRKAQGDINWIKEKCQLHEYVIEKAMWHEGKLIPIIPMKFGIIFKSKESLDENLIENYSSVKESLARIKGRHEYGVKAYLDEVALNKWIEERNNSIRTKKKEIEALPQGIAFFEQKKLKGLIDKISSEEIDKFNNELFNELSNIAETVTREKNLGKELTGKKEEMVFNVYFLIKEERIKEFQEGLEKFLKGYGSNGFQIRCIGPLAPYHFV